MDHDGNMTWLRQYGTGTTDYGWRGMAVVPGGVLAGAETTGSFGDFTNAGGFDNLILLYDNDGVLRWHYQWGDDRHQWTEDLRANGTTAVVVGDISNDGGYLSSIKIPDLAPAPPGGGAVSPPGQPNPPGFDKGNKKGWGGG